MATHAHTPGAQSRATIIPFPDTLLAQARRELNHCHNQRMFDRWLERAKRYQRLPHDERVVIGRHAVERHRIVHAEGS